MQDRSHALSCTLVSTEHSEGESLFYIISPKDIVVAKERDQDDHIDWLLDKKKYEVSVFFFKDPIKQTWYEDFSISLRCTVSSQ